jgi:hypothetical protein
MSKCFRHPQENVQDCKHCTKWRETFKYFKKRNCSHLTIYCAQFKHYKTEEMFYKIGLTSKTTDQRFDELRERFDIKIKWEVKANLYEAVSKEIELLYDVQVKQGRLYVPKAKKFSGSTECFL